ncbi:atherin [Melopsittacus undulatus]|uniref:atherin n=1 Tax=Melopsittacus undulatus TaxID=13146 RepID=UPI00146A0F21|nr:proapoptotic nucleolar protein 1 [Melopsittacus undulatus]
MRYWGGLSRRADRAPGTTAHPPAASCDRRAGRGTPASGRRGSSSSSPSAALLPWPGRGPPPPPSPPRHSPRSERGRTGRVPRGFLPAAARRGPRARRAQHRARGPPRARGPAAAGKGPGGPVPPPPPRPVSALYLETSARRILLGTSPRASPTGSPAGRRAGAAAARRRKRRRGGLSLPRAGAAAPLRCSGPGSAGSNCSSLRPRWGSTSLALHPGKGGGHTPPDATA